MTDYRAPLDDMRFTLREVAKLSELASLPGFEEADPELVEQILEEAGRQAAEVLAPLNRPGDIAGARLENGVVRPPEGFAEAYRGYVEAGWNSLPFDPDHGGQGLPWTVALAVTEMWNSANMAWALCPLLTVGAVELLQAHGSEAQKATYLPRLISGEWTGTMCLTEPQAGSDVGALKTRAVREDGHYRITGQKIYITWGEHNMTENIVHMVLARTPDAPAGTKGVSLFLVPKFIPRADGTPGRRNDVRCVSIEEKLGIHGSPTCTLAFGDNEGAVGYLVGEEGQGMRQMFTMMNNARLNVGLQGLAVAERAYQDARAFAFERVQSRPIDASSDHPVTIVHHPNVRRKLLTMKAQVLAMRALAYYTGGVLDRAHRHPDAETRQRHQALVDLLTPIVKAWCTDLGVEVASTAIQVHGGMGFVEETGVAQYYRDVRIASIYEGTNGIQAMDLMLRKVLRDDGRAAEALQRDLQAVAERLDAQPGPEAAAIAQGVRTGLEALHRATESVLAHGRSNTIWAAATAKPYLQLFGTVAGGALLAQAADAAGRALGHDRGYPEATLRGTLAAARFYADNLMPRAQTYLAQVQHGADSVLAPDTAWL